MLAINDADFIRLVRFIRETYGINLEKKRQLIDARLAFDIKKRGYRDFTEYVSYIIKYPDSDECRHTVNKLSTNYTFFFRETDYIPHLENIVLRDFVSREKKEIKIWCSACSSGQEAYSLSMILESLIFLYRLPLDYRIICTDINTELLSSAKQAVYPCPELDSIPNRYRQYVKVQNDGTFIVCDTIREKIDWKYENLMSPICRQQYFDIVFCRNVLIYFLPDLRKQITEKLYAATAYGGYLFCGATESLDLERKFFNYLAPSFYQKRQGERK